MTTKHEKIKQAEDLLKNTLMHEREVLSQLWDVAQEDFINKLNKEKIKLLKEILFQIFNSAYSNSIVIIVDKIKELEKFDEK
jgi:hypothetical protein